MLHSCVDDSVKCSIPLVAICRELGDNLHTLRFALSARKAEVLPRPTGCAWCLASTQLKAAPKFVTTRPHHSSAKL